MGIKIKVKNCGNKYTILEKAFQFSHASIFGSAKNHAFRILFQLPGRIV